MMPKFFLRRKLASESEMQALEAKLQAALQPVEPSPEFVRGVRARLMRSFARRTGASPSSVSVFGGLWRAVTRYGSAIAALTGLRAWRGVLVALVFVLGGGQRTRETLQTEHISSAA